MSTTNTPSSPWAEPDVHFEYQEEQGIATDGINKASEDTRSPTQDRRRQIGGAAAVGGIAGLVLAGPVIGLVAAGGAAAVAAKGKGAVGDVARATGNMASHAGERVKQFDKKHKVTKKTSEGFVKGCNWVSKKIATPKKSST
jgi:hypothetical protein